MITYKVQYGDTLHSIANQFRICAPILAMTNNMFYPCQVFRGQELLIPTVMSNNDLTFIHQRQQYDLEIIKKIFSQEGSIAGGIYKFTFPRKDLMVRIGDVKIDPDLALTSWVAFNKLESRSMLMGDLVLLESEVDPVMSSLFENGIQVTALHNHLLFETPRIMYMHIKGEGNPVKFAQGIRKALSLTTTPFKRKSQLSSRIDWSIIENIVGHKGSRMDNVLQLSFPRHTSIIEDGQPMSPAMGISHGINFQNLGDKVAATGDFVLFADEVNPVASILKKNNIAVTAIHNHTLTETPRLFFMHFWAVDKPEYLAQTFRSVINLAN